MGIVVVFSLVMMIVVGSLLYSPDPSHTVTSTVSTTTSTTTQISTSPTTSSTTTTSTTTQNPQFYWGVEEGDEFHYLIRIYGEMYEEWPDDPIVALNNSEIQVAITSLPNVSTIRSEYSFISLLLDNVKVSCTYPNGSALTTSLNDQLSTVLSFGFLPLGSWNWIEDSFPQEFLDLPVTMVEYLIATRKTSESLWIGYEENTVYEVDGYEANVSLSTGVPTYVLGYFFQCSCGPGTRFIDFILVQE